MASTDQDWIPEGLLRTLHVIWPSVNPEGFDFEDDPAGPQLLDDLRCFDCEHQNSLPFSPAPSSPSDTHSISTYSSLTASEAPELAFELRSPAGSDGSFGLDSVLEDIPYDEAMIVDEVSNIFRSGCFGESEEEIVLSLADGLALESEEDQELFLALAHDALLQG
ncbi:hypothetical protein NCS57_00949400 [Fusarium keratoplasticum]|uniref:Uncharacterized protein n=1 Tax=Fusarium keratoplasticum TaxID=1328300 RepID=A0ACC0QQ52_9HYPO|nr:hypothetical protein NCS57_00949400 [Fusarium keratoplasticum]KAI8663483.1 hypothetical protein NCS57_00949400 [Fusarium keratoplasticum]